MDTVQMSYILALSKENYNITRTARRLYITQAALSKSLHTVEEKLGVELFLRENGRLSGLSPAGKVFIRYTEQILGSYQHMCEELSGFSGTMSGAVRIGIPGDLIDVLFYSALPKLIMSYPSVQLDLNEGAPLELEQCFASNELDILIAVEHNRPGMDDYEKTHLVSQPYGAFLSNHHPLAAKSKLSWKDLSDYPLALPARSFTRVLVLSRLMERGYTPHVAVNVSSNRMLIRSVQDSQVLTILPRVFYQINVTDDDPIVWRPIEDPINWNVELLMKRRHRELNDIICRMYDCIREIDLSAELSAK